jgi:sec-independent protein translocase protein TatA|tara:strand:- start:681 stop:866 length:186 start_codon:yes stop_codon:yes gene_type:complete
MKTSILLLGMPGGWELIIIAIVILLLFGGRKIPELMRGLGSGIKEFKNASKEDGSHDKKDK